MFLNEYHITAKYYPTQYFILNYIIHISYKKFFRKNPHSGVIVIHIIILHITCPNKISQNLMEDFNDRVIFFIT